MSSAHSVHSGSSRSSGTGSNSSDTDTESQAELNPGSRSEFDVCFEPPSVTIYMMAMACVMAIVLMVPDSLMVALGIGTIVLLTALSGTYVNIAKRVIVAPTRNSSGSDSASVYSGDSSSSSDSSRTLSSTNSDSDADGTDTQENKLEPRRKRRNYNNDDADSTPLRRPFKYHNTDNNKRAADTEKAVDTEADNGNDNASWHTDTADAGPLNGQPVLMTFLKKDGTPAYQTRIAPPDV